MYMKVHTNGPPFSMGIIVPVDIKPGTGEKLISLVQVRYAIRIIYMFEKITHPGFTIRETFTVILISPLPIQARV